MWKKSYNKKPKEELQEYLKFRNRGSKTPNKKAYTRKEKHKSKGDWMGKFSNIDLSSKEIAEKYGLRASDVVEITDNFL